MPWWWGELVFLAVCLGAGLLGHVMARRESATNYVPTRRKKLTPTPLRADEHNTIRSIDPDADPATDLGRYRYHVDKDGDVWVESYDGQWRCATLDMVPKENLDRVVTVFGKLGERSNITTAKPLLYRLDVLVEQTGSGFEWYFEDGAALNR